MNKRIHKSTCRCASCLSKKGLYVGKNNPNYKENKTKRKYFCKENDCNNQITYNAYYFGQGRCMSCSKKELYKNGRILSKEHKEKIRKIMKNKTGKKNPNWVDIGSTYKNNSGYIMEKTEFGWKPQHRIVVEKILNRKIKKGEVIHHIDENKENNNPDNLYLFLKRGLHSCFTQLVKYNIINLNTLKSNLISLKEKEDDNI